MRSATTDTVSSSERIDAVVLCAGKGERTGLEYNKVLYVVGQKTVLETTLDVFARTEVERIVLVISRDDEKAISPLVKPYRNVKTVYGGATRTESVRLGLKALSGCDIVVIHDGARPFVTADTIAASIESAQRFGSGIAAVPTVDTIKQVEDGAIVRSLDRSILYNIQTPQTFRYAEILEAYETASGVYTDDSEVYEKAGHVPHIVRGAYDNIKLTTPADLIKAPTGVRIGVGYDLHRLVNDRPLILGGSTAPQRTARTFRCGRADPRGDGRDAIRRELAGYRRALPRYGRRSRRHLVNGAVAPRHETDKVPRLFGRQYFGCYNRARAKARAAYRRYLRKPCKGYGHKRIQYQRIRYDGGTPRKNRQRQSDSGERVVPADGEP